MTRKKRQIRLLAAIAALAVLGLAYVLVSRADWNREKADTVTEELSILTMSPAEIREAVITNSYGTLRLSYDGETWTSPDDPSVELNQDALTTLWGCLNPLSAVRDLGEAPEDLSAYSLSDPAITIELTREDGSEITEEFVHITARAMFDSMFEVVRHRMDRDTARKYLHMLEKYHYGGWGAIIKLG